jgi:hypothetical protein
MKIIQHVFAPSISIIILDMLSHDLVSRMMGFTMTDPPGIVCHKPIGANVFTHIEL